MSALIVARKEFQDAVRSRVLWGVVAVIAVMTGLSASLSAFVPALEAGPETAIGGASQFAGLLVPIVALVAAALSIAGERESGSLKVLLGLPVSRGTVMLGKFLGRSGVVALGVGVGFGLSGVVVLLFYGRLPLGPFFATLGLTVLLGVVFVGIALGISALSPTRARAMTLAVGAYLGLTLLWDLFPTGVHLSLTGQLPGESVPAWFLFLQSVSPTGAYTAVIRDVLSWGAPAVGAGPGGLSILLHTGVPLFLLTAWTIVPMAVGFARFRRADLS
jgi:ABC-2 type transport system permease protein